MKRSGTTTEEGRRLEGRGTLCRVFSRSVGVRRSRRGGSPNWPAWRTPASNSSSPLREEAIHRPYLGSLARLGSDPQI
jgi:hypothetical protein